MKYIRGLLSIVGAAAIGWAAYWYASGVAFKASITTIAPAQTVSLTGFPSDYAVKLEDIQWGDRDHLAVITDSLVVLASTLAPNEVSVDVAGPHRISGRLGDVVVTSPNAVAEVWLDPTQNFELGRSALVAEELTVEAAAAGIASVGRLEFASQSLDGEAQYGFALSGENISVREMIADLPSEFSSLSANISGGILTSSPLDASMTGAGAPAIRALRISSGTVQWGSSTIDAAGQINFVDGGLPEGIIELTVTNWQPLYQLAKARGSVDPELDEFFMDALTQLEAQSDTPGAVKLPLSIRDGIISYGALRLGFLTQSD